VILLAAMALGHEPGLSSARIDTSHVSLSFSRVDLAGPVPFEDLELSRLLIAETTLDKVRLSSGGGVCTFETPLVREAESDGVEVVAAFTCPQGPGEWSFAVDYFATLPAGHRQYLEVNGVGIGVLSRAESSARFPAMPQAGEVARTFLLLGVEHIWTGTDHLAFLAAILLSARSLRSMLLVVTGFTVAHSVTLSLAATGVFTLSPAFVEPAIAASIVFVGVENFYTPTVRRRMATTFLLGLVHGFGFAGLLVQLGLPRGNLAVALLCFNGGVELGQAAVVAVALPVLLRLGKHPRWQGTIMPVLSALIALAGFVWLVQRTVLR
jgi:hydrogenase/urease accessory protein HupE